MSELRIGLSKDAVEGACLRFTSGEHTCPPGFRLAEHAHCGLWQADWVLSGQMEYAIAGLELVAGGNELMFIPPELRHSLASRTGCSYCALKFEAPIWLRHDRPIHVRLSGDAPLLGLLAAEVFTRRHPPPWPMSYGFFGALLCMMQPIMAGDDQMARTEGDNRILDAQGYAVGHLRERLTVADLAARVHLSPSHFSRRFQTMTGEPPGKWITRRRMLRAVELLEYADVSISDISAEVGFVDLPTFSKAFRRWKGISPSSYRDRQLAKRR